MTSFDCGLGRRIQGALITHEIESPIAPYAVDRSALSGRIADFLIQVGLNLNDDRVAVTPSRMANMLYDDLLVGMDYAKFPECAADEVASLSIDQVVTAERIEVNSLCMHHFIPFLGDAYIAYIPRTKLLGLSKFNRVVDFFSRRPQLQELLTAQITLAFREILETDDVAVVLRCQHFCVRLRGIKQRDTWTTTSQLLGRFRTVPELRSEFFSLIRRD